MGSLRNIKLNNEEIEEIKNKTLMTFGMVQATQTVLTTIAGVIEKMGSAIEEDIYDSAIQIEQIDLLTKSYSTVLSTFNGNQFVPTETTKKEEEESG